MAEAGTIIGAILGVGIGLFLIITFVKAIYFVREREQIIVERCGRFHSALNPGPHCICPYVDRPKTYTWKYILTDNRGREQVVSKVNEKKIMTKNEVIDFPKQHVITRDNASIQLDAILTYRIVNPKAMIYNTQNLPRMLSKLLQAQIRNVAGSLDVDQIIEDSSAMDRVSGELDLIASRWGVKIDFVKIQQVVTGSLEPVLARKKAADLKNQEVVINAKRNKQTAVIESEGMRDQMQRVAQGEMQAMLSKSRGESQAIRNKAIAEAETINQISASVSSAGEDVSKYLIALKYIDALTSVLGKSSTTVKFLPKEISFMQSAQSLGLNTIAPFVGGAR